MPQAQHQSELRLRDARDSRPLVLDSADLSALLDVLTAQEPPDVERLIVRLRTLLGPAAERFEPHLHAVLARARELKRTQRIAATDALTGLANRRGFGEALRRELARSARTGASLAVLLLDLDDFKAINDVLGHAAGDDALRKVARCLQRQVRQGDLAARLGGDELALLLPDTNAADARTIAERIRASVAGARGIGSQGSASPAISASVGVAVAAAGSSVQKVLADADRDMYRDKTARKSLRPAAPQHSSTAA